MTKKMINTKTRINADSKRIIADNKVPLLYEKLTYKVRGCIYEVYNTLGYGHKEKVYQKALAKEFNNNNIPFNREVSLNVKYKNQKVGNYRPDFLVDDKVILELKAVRFMPKSHYKQLAHYLKGTGYKIGFLVNFGAPKLVIKRVIWSKQPNNPRKSAINQ